MADHDNPGLGHFFGFAHFLRRYGQTLRRYLKYFQTNNDLDPYGIMIINTKFGIVTDSRTWDDKEIVYPMFKDV